MFRHLKIVHVKVVSTVVNLLVFTPVTTNTRGTSKKFFVADI